MGVIVYSRLGDVLRQRNLTVDDLQRQIAARFGLAVDTRTLDRMTRDERVRRPDLEIAAAAAAVLGVGLDDVFTVETMPAGDLISAPGEVAEADDVLSPKQSQRLSDLFDLRERRPLTGDEQAELGALVGAWSRAVSEREFRELAQRRGGPVEQVRAETLAETERVLSWWKEIEADPVRLAELLREARAHRQVGSRDAAGDISSSANRHPRAV